jgi:hypothetical protein
MFSNKFDVGIIISNFLQDFCCLKFSLNFHFFPFFPNKNCQIKKKLRLKQMMLGGGGGGGGVK